MKVLLAVLFALLALSFAQDHGLDGECAKVDKENLRDNICVIAGLLNLKADDEYCVRAGEDGIETKCTKEGFHAYVDECPKLRTLHHYCSDQVRCFALPTENEPQYYKKCTKEEDCKDPCEDEESLKDKNNKKCYCRAHNDDKVTEEEWKKTCGIEEKPICFSSCTKCFTKDECKELHNDDGDVWAGEGDNDCVTMQWIPEEPSDDDEGDEDGNEDEGSSAISFHQFGLLVLVVIALFF